MSTTLKTVGYVRVSTEEQVREGVSLDAQEERVRAYATAKGWHLIRVYRDEGASAKDLNRSGAQALLSRLRSREFGAVIVCKLDRLTRSVRDLGHLLEAFQKAHVALSSIEESLDTSTATGKLLVNILGSVAQWEREQNGERTKNAMHYKREHREVYSPEPFGYKSAGASLVEIPQEQQAIKLMRQLKESGISFRSICQELEQRNIRPRQGKRWHPSVVMRILLNPLHAESSRSP